MAFIGAQHFHRFVAHAHGGFKGFAHEEIGLRFHQFKGVLAVESAHNQPRVGADMFGDFHNAGGGVGIVDANQNAISIFCAGGMQNVFARAIAVIHFKAVFIGLADDVGIVVDNRNLRAIGNRRLAGDLADAAEADNQHIAAQRFLAVEAFHAFQIDAAFAGKAPVYD